MMLAPMNPVCNALSSLELDLKNKYRFEFDSIVHMPKFRLEPCKVLRMVWALSHAVLVQFYRQFLKQPTDILSFFGRL